MTIPELPAIRDLLNDFDQGAQVLASVVAGLTESQLRTAAAPGRWSPLEVVSHIADAEILYADRLVRVLGMEQPALPGMDPDAIQARVPGNARVLADELELITVLRRRMGRLLRQFPNTDFQRIGLHSEAGPLTAHVLLARVVRHLPHHAEIIRQKRPNLGAPPA